MIRYLPGDPVIECKGTPSHHIAWYGQQRCHCGADLPIKAPRPEPIIPPICHEPTAQQIPYLNRAWSLAQHAPGKWHLAAAWMHHGVSVAVDVTGNNRARAGTPFHVTIRYTMETYEQDFPTRKAAYQWLIDHVSSVPLWPNWTLQQEN